MISLVNADHMSIARTLDSRAKCDRMREFGFVTKPSHCLSRNTRCLGRSADFCCWVLFAACSCRTEPTGSPSVCDLERENIRVCGGSPVERRGGVKHPNREKGIASPFVTPARWAWRIVKKGDAIPFSLFPSLHKT